MAGKKGKNNASKRGGYADNNDAGRDWSISQIRAAGGNMAGLKFDDVGGLLEVKENNSKEIFQAIDKAVAAALEEIGLRAERHAKLECPVDTGRLRNSITHQIMPSDKTVIIGTNVEYAEYVEKNDRAAHKNGKAHFLHDAGANHQAEYSKVLENHLKNG